MSTKPSNPLPIIDRLAFGESLRWHDGRLWFVDMHAGQVCSWSEATGVVTEVQLATSPSGLGWNAAGELLVVSMEDRRLLRVDASGTQHLVADLGGYTPHRINDMVIDADGRAYIGTFGFDLGAGAPLEPGAILAVDADGSHRVAADDLVFPNGLVLTDGGRTLVVAETFGGRLTAFTRAADGSLEDRRLWASLSDDIAPDGICLAADGAIWVSSTSTAEVVLVAEGGTVLQRISTAPQMAVCCVTGGAAGTTLFVTSCDHFDAESALRDRSARIAAIELAR